MIDNLVTYPKITSYDQFTEHKYLSYRCTRASHVQAQCHDVQLSTLSSAAAVPARRLPTSLRRRVTASSPICWSTTAERTALEAEHICPAGFLCGWPAGVELIAGLPERPSSWPIHFLKHLKMFLFAVYWCIQRVRGFTTMRSINYGLLS